jgi:succinate dehydrogenase/fumarate reductase flavoprotein subunit
MNLDGGSQATLPNASSVLIIGGGLARSSAAITLADRGHDVISLANLKRSLTAARRRRINIKPAGRDRMTAG